MVQKMFARASILLHHMGHQAQVALNEDIPGIQVPLGREGQVVFLLFFGQRFGKASRLKLQ